MKTCSRCKVEKNLDLFQVDKRAKDGRRPDCKECANKLYRERYHRPETQERIRRYRRTESFQQNWSRWRKKYREQNPVKVRAHYVVANAVYRGVMERKTICEECGAGGRIEAHHDDYTKQMEVRWLCHRCHRAWHRINGEGRVS